MIYLSDEYVEEVAMDEATGVALLDTVVDFATGEEYTLEEHLDELMR